MAMIELDLNHADLKRASSQAGRDGVSLTDWIRNVVLAELSRREFESARRWKMWADGRDD